MYLETVRVCLLVAYKNRQLSLCLPNDLNVINQALTPGQQINVALLIMQRLNEDGNNFELPLYDWVISLKLSRNCGIQLMLLML
jgi:hypothetical protein